ncbi:hypothetical protein [Glaciihabitans sp. UYNi722]|uniref:hypothetical protein n=1 Tax=Glaciihabitans sp. UYNi722 TaxID=3156344 RepID=UPI00339698B1
MTAAVAYDGGIHAPRSRRARPHGLNRVVMRLSIVMLKWARRRAERSALTYEESARLLRMQQQRQAHENETALMAMRLL